MDAVDFMRSIASLALVLALLLGSAYALRRWGHRIPGININAGTAEKRLAVVTTQSIDPRRKLVLIRRDQVEHLLMVGPEGAVLVEAGIPTASNIDKAQ